MIDRSAQSMVWFVNSYWFPRTIFEPSFFVEKCVVLRLFHPFRDYGTIAYLGNAHGNASAFAIESIWDYSWADVMIVLFCLPFHYR